jgi:hypothetical protein
MKPTLKHTGQDTTTKKVDTQDPQAVNKKIAERLAYFNKLDAKQRGHKDDEEEDSSED